MRTAVRWASLCAAALCLAPPASADPIQITSGALVGTTIFGSGSSVTLVGDGFTLIAGTHFGVFGLADCLVPECTAGSTVDLRAYWSGIDLSGTATVEGITYWPVGSLSSPWGAEVDWTGSLIIPDDFAGGTLTAPFAFAGAFYGTSAGRLALTGTGQASVTFAPNVTFPGAFSVQEYRYDFDPVPEPTSMLLIGTGLAGLAMLRRRQSGRA